MLGAIFLILCAIILLLLLFLFFRYYGMNIRFNTANLYEFSIFVFSYIPILMGVAILPFEISKYYPAQETPVKTNTALLTIQYLFYYLNLFISFFLNPFLMEFKKVSQESDQPLVPRLKQAFRKVFIFYIIIGSIAILGLIILLISKIKFSISLVLGILPSILNLYGLVMYMVSIGIGMIKIPLTIWHKASPVNVFRDTLIELDEASKETPDQSADESNHSRYYNNLLKDSKKQYEDLIGTDIKQDRKKIAIKMLKYSAAVSSGLFFLVYIIFECSYAFREDRNKFILHIFLTKINNQPMIQLFLFIFVGLMTTVGAYMLTCIDLGSIFPNTVRGLLAKLLNIFEYRFVKGETIPKTFEFWSTYLQRLIPTIAYHCQRLAGAEESSLQRIMGQLDNFYFFSKFMKMTLPPFLVIIILIYVISIIDDFPDSTQIQNGLNIFRAQMLNAPGPDLDNYVVYDVLNRDAILNSIRDDSENHLDIQLSSTSSFHDPLAANNNDNIY